MKILKSSLAVLLSVCIAFATVIPAFANTDTKTEEKVFPDAFYGDVDSDKDVDMQDVLELEKYIADEKTKIDELNADVNADGYINYTDVKMLKDYLLGNIESLTPDLVKVTFDTKGGSEVEPMFIGRGYGIVKEIPSPSKEDCIFTGWKKSNGSDFYKEDPVNEDMTLVAQYEGIENNEEVKIDSYAVADCDTNINFSVKGNFNSAAEVKANVTLVPKDGSDPVEIKVTKEGNGTFSIGAATSFNPGSSYELALGEGITFVDKDANIRKVNFVIKKAEGDNLQYNPNVKFIKDTEEMKYTVSGGATQDVLESNLLNNKESNDDITGTFIKSDGSLAIGDIVCIYENIDPRNRDYTDDAKAKEYQDDSIAYIRITDVKGNTYSFESLSDEDADQVLMMPDSIPFKVDTLPTGETGQVKKSDYDTVAREKLGFKKAPEYKKGDFLIFYACNFEDATEDTEVVYGQVTGIYGDNVTYKKVEKSYVDDFMGMFVKQDVDSETLTENIDKEKLLNSVAKQVEESDFAEESAGYMLQSAMEDEKVIDAMKNNGMTKKEIDYYATASDIFTPPTGARRTTIGMEGITVQPTFIVGNRFKEGVGVAIEVHVVLSLDTKIGSNISSLKIDLFATFEQEIAVSMDVNVEDTWKWYLFVPVLKELTCNTSVDIQSYTSVSVGATMYSVNDIGMKKWKVFSERLKKDTWIYAMFKSYDALALKLQKVGKGAIEAQGIIEQMQDIENSIPKFVVDGKEYSFTQIRESLGAENVASAFADNFGAETDKESKISIQKLMDKYTNMLQNESDWVELVNFKVIDRDFNIKVVAINLTVRLMTRANINLSLGADLEYQVGKRYNFWVKVVSRTAGSSEMDLIDEKFGFQLYIMGTLGMRFGVKAEINLGIISTKLGSIGANIEFGPYIKVWGYLCYVYTKHRPANTNKVYENEETKGAMLFELGLYLTVRFKAQILDGTFKYEPTLYDDEFPLIKKGEETNVYDFTLSSETDKIRINDSDNYGGNGITMNMSEYYRRMKTIDLKTGEQKQEIYDPSNFVFTTSSRKITVDKNGVITVNPTSDDRYLEGTVKITWKSGKLAFSKFDMSITIPVYWTNYSDQEINEKFTASVAVGNSKEGYNVVWSNRYSRMDKFNLPTKEKVLELIKYDSFESDKMNLKYSKVDGYKTASENLSISQDTIYYFDVTKREYTAKVSGVQNTDGTTTSKTYKAFYGETFDMSDLSETGTDNPVVKAYTVFSKLIKADDVGKEEDKITEFPLSTIVNSAFYNTYGTNAELVANYADNSATATYTFSGITAKPVTITFKKGETPYYEGLDDYIEAQGGEGTRRVGITPAVGKVQHSVEYVVICKKAPPLPKYTLKFETKGGSLLDSQQYYAGSELFVPTTPTRTGYDFKGWYTDSACTNPFSFDTLMPENDITIYAKWTPKTFGVSFYNVNGEIETFIKQKTITYNSEYGAFPDPYDLFKEQKETQKFIGWFTAKTEGEQVTEKTLVRTLTNVKLYARWENKTKVEESWIKLGGSLNTTFDNTPHPTSISVTEGPTDNYVIEYMKEGGSWSNSAPINAGKYSVKVTRVTCEDYLKFEKVFSNVMTIKKKDVSLGSLSVSVKGNTVAVRRPDNYRGSGKITYTLSGNSRTSTTGIFNDVPSGSYTCSISVGNDDNYNYIINNKTSGTFVVSSVSNYSISFRVVNGTGSGAGTDGEIYAMVEYTDGSNSGWKQMDSSANDFENGDDRTYAIASCDPFKIKGIRLKSDVGIDHWQCNYVEVIAENGSDRFVKKVNFNNRWFEKVEDSGTYSCYLYRSVTLENSISGSQTINLNNTSSFNFNNSGRIKSTGTAYYHPMQYAGYPTFSVTASNNSNNSALLNYIQYTEPTKFDIDIAGLKDYVAVNGVDNFSYYINYTFPSYATIGTSTYSKTITVNTSGIKKATGVASTGASKDDYTLSVENKVSAEVGDEIMIPVKISGTQPLWGVMAQVNYNTEQLELLGAEGKGIFSVEKFAAQNDLSKETFKFIATNDKIDNVKADGTIAMLKFKVKAVDEVNGFGITAGVLQSAVYVEKKDEPVKKPTSTTTVKTAKNLKKGTALASAEKLITKTKNDKDISGSVYRTLQTKSKKVSKTSIAIKWNKVKSAKKYVVYGSKCGSKYKKLKTTSSKTTSFTNKKLKKGTYYKYLVVAVDSKSKVVSASKTVHIATKGGKVGNYKAIKTSAKKNKVTIKKGKSFKLNTKVVAESKKLKVKKHRGIKYEITNSKVLKISSKGKITAKKKGACYVYAYAQNGISKKIKVTVKK